MVRTPETYVYDNIIDQINHGPEIMQRKQGISRINIFDEYAGITIEDRGFQPPEGIRVFKSVGLIKADGTWEPHPTLTPKAKAPPPSSPKTANRVLRGPTLMILEESFHRFPLIGKSL